MTLRKCRACGKRKPLGAFHRNGLLRNGRPDFRARCKRCENPQRAAQARAGRRTDPPPKQQGLVDARTRLPESKIFVVTYAQNATPVKRSFFESLLTYCRVRGAELIVIPGRYRNPTSIWSRAQNDDEWWAPELAPYLFKGRARLGEHLTVYGDISIQPTAVTPLTGFEVFAGPTSAIFGHPKLQLTTIATAHREYPRILTTTGAVTRANYTDTKAGMKGEAHHVYGATVVEQGPRLFHIRQINAQRDGTFIDLDTHYAPVGSKPAPRPLALVCGDIHVEKADPRVVAATFEGARSICGALRPRHVVLHDVLDFSSRSHHEMKHFHKRYERAHGFTIDRVEREVRRAVAFLTERPPQDAKVVVVASNHDEHFDRWLRDTDPRLDAGNARFWIEAWRHVLDAFHRQNKPGRPPEWPGAFATLYKVLGGQRAVRFLRRNESFALRGIELGFHGDKGLNGSRGTLATYAKLGTRSVVGHAHSPGIRDGAYQTGAMMLDAGYNDLPSSHLTTHCVIYANAKRSLIHVIDGAWRG